MGGWLLLFGLLAALPAWVGFVVTVQHSGELPNALVVAALCWLVTFLFFVNLAREEQ